jgi:hypothetical protein
MEKKVDLIDRYLYQVGRDLPANKRKRADIQAELRSLIVDALDSRYPGQEAGEEQVAEVLKAFGPPDKVAASYFPEGQYLVGPRLYPQFRLTLGIVFTIFLIVQVVLFGVAVVFQPESLSVDDLLGGLFSGLMTAFGIVVAIFWLLQRYEVQTVAEAKEWEPRDLPALPTDEPVSRVERLVGITFGLVALGLLISMPAWLAEFIGSPEALNPLFYDFIPWIIALTLVGIALDLLLLWRGHWETWTRVLKILDNILGLVLVLAMLAAHVDWLAARGLSGFMAFPEIPAGGGLPLATAQALAVQGTRIALIVTAIVLVVEIGVQAYKLVRAYLNRGNTERLGMEIDLRRG